MAISDAVLIERTKAVAFDQHMRNTGPKKPRSFWCVMKMTIDSNYSLNQLMNQESNSLAGLIVLVVSLFQSLGCDRADKPGVYRESRGEVVKYTAELSDPVIKVVQFARLQDGSVQSPRLYYYQVEFSGLMGGAQRVEKSGGIFRTLGKKLPDTHRVIFLPRSEDIAEHLLLVSTSYPKEIEVLGAKEKIYKWHDWQLWEVPAIEITPGKPIVFPPFKDLQGRKPSEETEALRQTLVKKYGKISAAARIKANTPGGQKPLDCESQREPGTYLKGCGEVRPVATKISEPVVQVARFVKLRDGSVLMPKLKYFWYESESKQDEYTLQVLRSDGHKNQYLDLPLSKEIDEYLLLVRVPILQNSAIESALGVTDSHLEENDLLEIKEWSSWELIELTSEYIAGGASLKLPSCKELGERELSEEKQELLSDLVARYNKIKVTAKRNMDAPISPSSHTPKTVEQDSTQKSAIETAQ